MRLESLHDLYLSELNGLYNAEKQLIKALPKMIQKATSPDLRRVLEDHLTETQTQLGRLQQIFEMHNETPKSQKSPGMEGILAEGVALVERDAAPAVRDAAIVSALQRVKHYEMAIYGTVRTYADQLGHARPASMLQETLDEERGANQKLTGIATNRVNIEATRTA
jgi:ferritin-like metal-binding protein YciE